MEIKCHLFEYRIKKGWSLNEVHKLTGLSIGYLDDLQNNKQLPRIDYAYRLAKAFNISVYDLFEIIE
mgnify:CR=1 FL=1